MSDKDQITTESHQVPEVEVNVPEAVREAKAKGVKGFFLTDPFGQEERFYFRDLTKADLAFYVKGAALRRKPKIALERLACDCAIHPSARELETRFKADPALSAAFQEEFLKRLGGGRFLTWSEVKGDAAELPEPVRKALGAGTRVVRIADDFETREEFFFRRPGSLDQENFLTTASIRQKPLVAMERIIRDCAVHPPSKELIKRFAAEPALAMDLHEQLNESMGGGRGFDAQDF